MEPENEHVQALSRSLNETPFLREHREQAWKRLQNDHPDFFQALSSQPERSLGTAFCMGGEDHRNNPKVLADIFAGMQTGDISKEQERLFEEHFSTLLSLSDDPAVLRHYAFLSLGFFIFIPQGVELQKPLRLTYRNVSPWAGSHIVLIVGKGSKVRFAENFLPSPRKGGGVGGGGWSHVAEVFLGDGAELEYVSFQAADPEQTLWIRHRSRLGNRSKIAWRNVTLGGQQVDHHLESSITGADAESTVDWLAYAKDQEQYRLSARNIFGGSHGGGEITMKGIAEERASINTHGMIEILQNGGGTNTYLTQSVLMLDPTARVDAVPALEIKTNDVKASHSATIARVTDEDLFYFAARGISPEEARGMFVQGFLGDLTKRMTDEERRKTIREAVQEKYARK